MKKSKGTRGAARKPNVHPKKRYFNTPEDEMRVKVNEVAIKAKGIIEQNQNDTSTKRRGLVYISHLPHGFYEPELKEYFSQFGKVRKVRVMRSAKSGRSKGHAFVEFWQNEVAKVAAESMNNYLMDKRLLKAKFIPANERPPFVFRGKDFTPTDYPLLRTRRKMNWKKNMNKSPRVVEKLTVKAVKKVKGVQNRLKAMGVDYKLPMAVRI